MADGHPTDETTTMRDVSAPESVTVPGGTPIADPTSEIDVVMDDLLDEIYAGQERITQAEIHRRAVAAELPADVLIRITALPEGEYAVDEAAELLGAREAR